MKDAEPGYARFGPFAPRELDSIRETLQEKGIEFEEHLDEEAFAADEAARRALPASAHPTRSYDPRFVYIDVPEAHADKIPDELEKVGFFKKDPNEPDFSQEDYHCPRCRYESRKPGYCPEHKEKLLTFSEWNDHERQKKEGLSRSGKVMVAAAFALLAAWILYWTHKS